MLQSRIVYGGLKEITVETVGGSDTRLPLNSKHLTVGHLRQIGEAMWLPTTASLDEMQGMVKGHLVDQGKEPVNVQVWLQEDTGITLCDEDGAFLSIKAPEPVPEVPTPLVSLDLPSMTTESDTSLRADLEKAQ